LKVPRIVVGCRPVLCVMTTEMPKSAYTGAPCASSKMFSG
jgi:hypothetical protein